MAKHHSMQACSEDRFGSGFFVKNNVDQAETRSVREQFGLHD